MPPGWNRNELGALLVAAGFGQPAEHALISLLALNGLRVSEATGANAPRKEPRYSGLCSANGHDVHAVNILRLMLHTRLDAAY
jgi:hypothetical protein